MTRPTACTTSTTDLRGLRNMTASSAVTSTPSDRQRALVKMRQTVPSLVVSALSHCRASVRFKAFILPSTCLTSQRRKSGSDSTDDSGSFPAADNFHGVFKLQFLVFCELVLQGHADVLLIHGENQNFVVREQFALNGF